MFQRKDLREIRNRRTVGLLSFLRGNTNPEKGLPGCANYDHHYGGCLFEDKCKVEQGERCAYFEKVVLPTAEDIGLKHSVYALYAKHTGISEDGRLEVTAGRKCPDCGTGLRPRQKFCDRCAAARRRKTKRKNQRKYREKEKRSVNLLST